jgi:hypothetical protein
MSSDFFIDLDQMNELGLIELEESQNPDLGDYEAFFFGYPYWRFVDVIEVNAPLKLHVSCGGEFRAHLKGLLDQHEINYEMF